MSSLRAAPKKPAILLEVEGEEGVDVAKKMSEAYARLESAAVEAE
jgi:hypothetical protein